MWSSGCWRDVNEPSGGPTGQIGTHRGSIEAADNRACGRSHEPNRIGKSSGCAGQLASRNPPAAMVPQVVAMSLSGSPLKLCWMPSRRVGPTATRVAAGGCWEGVDFLIEKIKL